MLSQCTSAIAFWQTRQSINTFYTIYSYSDDKHKLQIYLKICTHFQIYSKICTHFQIYLKYMFISTHVRKTRRRFLMYFTKPHDRISTLKTLRCVRLGFVPMRYCLWSTQIRIISILPASVHDFMDAFL